MDRGAWRATVHGVAKMVGHDWATKQETNEQLRGRGRREEGGKEERDGRGEAQKAKSEEMTFPISAQLLSVDPDSERANTGILNIVWKLRSLHNYWAKKCSHW